MNTILIIIGLLAVAVGVYYFGFYQKGKINDRDGDLIPDEVEDAVEDIKDTAKEVKRRAKNVKAELKDVVEPTSKCRFQSNRRSYMRRMWRSLLHRRTRY